MAVAALLLLLLLLRRFSGYCYLQTGVNHQCAAASVASIFIMLNIVAIITTHLRGYIDMGYAYNCNVNFDMQI